MARIRSGRKSLTSRIRSRLANTKFPHGLMPVGLTSKAPTSKNLSRTYQAENGIDCIWPNYSSVVPTSCCSTNRPTISMLKPCELWRKVCWPFPVVPLSSPTIGGSWTASAPIFSHLKAIARCSGTKEITAITKPIAGSAWEIMRSLRGFAIRRLDDSPCKPGALIQTWQNC